MNYERELIEEMRKAHSNDDFVREFKGNLSPKVCKQLIDLFEKETYLSTPGETGAGLDTTIKDSLDLMIGYAVLESKKEKRRKKWAKLDSILCDALSKGVKEYYKEFRVFDEKYPHEWTHLTILNLLTLDIKFKRRLQNLVDMFHTMIQGQNS